MPKATPTYTTEVRRTNAYNTILWVKVTPGRRRTVIGVHETPTDAEVKAAIFDPQAAAEWDFNPVPEAHPNVPGDLTKPASWGELVTLESAVSDAVNAAVADLVGQNNNRATLSEIRKRVTPVLTGLLPQAAAVEVTADPEHPTRLYVTIGGRVPWLMSPQLAVPDEDEEREPDAT